MIGAGLCSLCPGMRGRREEGGREPSENNKTNIPRLGRVMSASPVVVSFVKNMSIIPLLIITNIINTGLRGVSTQTLLPADHLLKLMF